MRGSPAGTDAGGTRHGGRLRARSEHSPTSPATALSVGLKNATVLSRTQKHRTNAVAPPEDKHRSTDLQEAMDVVKNAMNNHDLTALQAALQASAAAVLQSAQQLSNDAKASLGEVPITHDGLTNRAPEVLATLAHEAAHSVAWQRGIKDTSRQGRYHNHRFQRVAEELGLHVQRDSAFGWTQTHLGGSTAAAYSGVLRELELYVPIRQPLAAAGSNQRPRQAIRTIAWPCGHRLVRDGRSAFAADATICTGCLTEATRLSA